MKKLSDFDDLYCSTTNYMKVQTDKNGLYKAVRKPAELSQKEIAENKKLRILGIKKRVESEFIYYGYPLDADKKVFRDLLSRVYRSLCDKGFWNKTAKDEAANLLKEIYKDRLHFPENLENPQPKLKIGQIFSIKKFGDGLGKIRKITFLKKADIFGETVPDITYHYDWSTGRKKNKIDIRSNHILESSLLQDGPIRIENCPEKERKYFARHPRTSIFYI